MTNEKIKCNQKKLKQTNKQTKTKNKREREREREKKKEKQTKKRRFFRQSKNITSIHVSAF